MKVNNTQPFRIVFSLYEHEFFGLLWEAFVVQLNSLGKLTLQHQIITPKNQNEFDAGLDDADRALIQLIDEQQPEGIFHFLLGKNTDARVKASTPSALSNFSSKNSDKRLKSKEYFIKIYQSEKDKPDHKIIRETIEKYLESRRQKILPLLKDKLLFEMGNDGEPTWKPIHYQPEPATVLFHFFKNETNCHYFPTIKHDGQKIDFQFKNAKLLANSPAWLLCEGALYHFYGNVDAAKLKPFLQKKYIEVPKHMEEEFFRKFGSQLIANFDVSAKGFVINEEKATPTLLVRFYELQQAVVATDLFSASTVAGKIAEQEPKFVFEFHFRYGRHTCRADDVQQVIVLFEKNETYSFYKCKRDTSWEKKVLNALKSCGFDLKGSRAQTTFDEAFVCIENLKQLRSEFSLAIEQINVLGNAYFLGESRLDLEVHEDIDWFDVKALVQFGPYKISMQTLRNTILKGHKQFTLPNGEIAVIPQVWLTKYSELFALSEIESDGNVRLKKHFFPLVAGMEEDSLQNVIIKRKLNALSDFKQIDDVSVSAFFHGTLRPYQQAGYNWMHFLKKYKFGGCLADDMGLGKTVQTLALLASMYENAECKGRPSLLVVPTSLVYNWELEAKKFTPHLRIKIQKGAYRAKQGEDYTQYDLVITTYGTLRSEEEPFSKQHFLYIILDEAHAIKNPSSQTFKAVCSLSSTYKLTLTGTPLENGTMDLWAQMHFLNPGLLGTQTYFKNQYATPIEKKGDQEVLKKLHTLIKPFVLRRHKAQVATDLPPKSETICYAAMTEAQEKLYEETKSYVRNMIFENESKPLAFNHISVLQGLTKLRQIANHPRLADEAYTGDSGKFDEVLEKLDEVLSENHKILVFSQFVQHLRLFKAHLDTEKISYCYLDGSTDNRMEQVQQFQQDNATKVFLISLKAGGVGLNLTAADYVFILDPWWNPAAEAQAIDRAHRIGQDKPVFVYKFISKNTVEEKILVLQERKKRLSSELITNEESFVKALDAEDIQLLLE